jgi:hypothetical protein
MQNDIENDERFYEENVSTFSAKVSSLTNICRREKIPPSSTRMKYIKACWLRRIKNLREMMDQ